MSTWKRAMHFLGLIEDYDEEYADVPVGDPAGMPPLAPEPPAAPRPEPSNVRRLAAGGSDLPPGGGFGDPAPPTAPIPTPPTGPMASGSVNVLTPEGQVPVHEQPNAPRPADRVHITSPTTFNDVEEVGSRFRDGIPVLMNLQAASENVAKRLLDFASGLIYGLDGRIERTGDRIFLLTPAGVTVSPDERGRLADRGLVS